MSQTTTKATINFLNEYTANGMIQNSEALAFSSYVVSSELSFKDEHDACMAYCEWKNEN